MHQQGRTCQRREFALQTNSVVLTLILATISLVNKSEILRINFAQL